ncbi:MAG: uroporphyrinogen decarboxylase family protein [Treponema sp.]|nr:uroporphyrinogen decarboxylase family protein [Treponema sp.]
MKDITSYSTLYDKNFPEIKKNLTDLFMGKNRGGLGYVVPLFSREKKDIPYTEYKVVQDVVHQEKHWDNMIETRLDALDRRVWGHDWGIPMFKPQFHMYDVEAAAFGSTYTLKPVGTKPVCRTLDEIDKLPDVTIDTDPLSYALSFLKYTDGYIQGNLPIEMFPGNGPISVAGLVVDQTEILSSVYEQPEKLGEFLGRLTDLYISFFKKQRETVSNISLQPMHDTWWPQECGILCEDDTFVNLSPQSFEKFIVPVYNKISDAFGGFGIHCCGDYSHLFTAFRDNIKNLRAVWINAGENYFEKAVDVFRGTNTVIITRWLMSNTKPYKNRIDFVRDTLRTKTDDVSVFIQGHRLGPVAREQNLNIYGYEIMHMIEHYNQYGTVL